MFAPFAFVKKVTLSAPSGPVVYISASGGTITTDGNYKVHTFSAGTSSFVVHRTGSVGYTSVEYLILGGGGGGTVGQSGAELGSGGAGGTARSGSYSVSLTTYSARVGTGGSGSTSADVNGNPGSVSSIFGTNATGGDGGDYTGPGGNNADYSGGGDPPSIGSGGGAGAGGNGNNENGGVGITSSISGTSLGYGGGGGGSTPTPGTVSDGGGVASGPSAGGGGTRGGGGGGDIWNGFTSPTRGGNGGDGIIIIRYQYQ